MEDGTTLLFDLPGFRVVECYQDDKDSRHAVVMGVAEEHACPSCGVLVTAVHQYPEMHLKDLPLGERPLSLRWRKRRYACPEQRCPRRTFTETSVEVPPRHRLTGRLRRKLESAASGSARALSDVGREYGVSWWSVNHALAVRAAVLLPDPRRCGCSAWTRPEPGRCAGCARRPAGGAASAWMTSFVDLDVGRPGGLIGLTLGRSGAAVQGWLAAQTPKWRAGVEVVALDPSAPFAAAIRRALPSATIVVDHWHLVRLANAMVTEVRQRVAREQLGHRGRKTDPAWAHRQLLLRAGDRLSAPALCRLRQVLAADDPTNEISAAWAVKELLR